MASSVGHAVILQHRDPTSVLLYSAVMSPLMVRGRYGKDERLTEAYAPDIWTDYY